MTLVGNGYTAASINSAGTYDVRVASLLAPYYTTTAVLL